MMIHEFHNPIPVVVEDNKDGYAIYVRDSGTFENDVWCVVHCDTGIVRHYLTDQIKIYANATFGIKKEKL
jgi:hypothetical protein